MVTCSKCGCLNEDAVVFCRECSQQIKVHSKAEISRMQQTSLCPNCDYYNPIEEVDCIKCGTSLRNADFVLKGRDGRESVIRDTGSGAIVSSFMWIVFLFVFVLFWGTGISSSMSSGGIEAFLSVPAGKVFGLTALLMITILAIEWKSDIVYRARLVTVFYLAFLSMGTLLGKGVSSHLTLGQLDFSSLLITGELITVLLGVLFLATTRMAGSVLAPLMAFIGLYCAVSPLTFLFSGRGLVASMQQVPQVLKGVPLWLSPSFLIYHVFLPYTFISVIGSAFTALLKSMEKVDGTKSIARFLNRRKEEARGELLNIFIVGITIFTGFSIMVEVRVPNFVSLVSVTLRRYF